MKGIINIQNEDDGDQMVQMVFSQIFKSCKQKSMKIRNVDTEFAKQLNFEDVNFPVHKKDYAKMEKQNNISISAFGQEDKIPYRIYAWKQTFEKHVDLLLLSNSKSCHYVLIKNIDRFMTNKIK